MSNNGVPLKCGLVFVQGTENGTIDWKWHHIRVAIHLPLQVYLVSFPI